MKLHKKIISCIRIIPIIFKSDNFYVVFSKNISSHEKELNFIPFGFNTIEIFSTNKWLTQTLSNGKISLKYDTTIKVEQDELEDLLKIVAMANDPKMMVVQEVIY